jgi:hypothetical protein
MPRIPVLCQLATLAHVSGPPPTTGATGQRNPIEDRLQSHNGDLRADARAGPSDQQSRSRRKEQEAVASPLDHAVNSEVPTTGLSLPH